MTRFAVIGAGSFGTKRACAIKQLESEGLKIEAIIDTNFDVGKSLATELECKVFTDILHAKDTCHLDAVVISTPNYIKHQIVEKCVQLRLAILCEKPIAHTREDALKIYKQCNEAGIIFKTGSNSRYFPNIQKAKELFDIGAIGSINFIRSWIGTNGARTKKTWFEDKAFSGGGSLIDHGSHIIDVIQWFTGPIEECIGLANQKEVSDQCEKTAMALMQSKSGTLISLQTSWVEWAGYFCLEIYGSDGFLTIDCFSGQTLLKIGNQSGLQEVMDFSKEPPNSLHLEILDFVDAINKGKSIRPNAYDGYQVVNLIHNVYDSMQIKKMVKNNDLDSWKPYTSMRT